MLTKALPVSVSSYIDPSHERPQPDLPTKVDLPDYSDTSCKAQYDWSVTPPPNFRASYAKLRRPADLSAQYISDLNINILTPQRVDELVPSSPNAEKYLPLLESNDCHSATSAAVQTYQTPFSYRLAELKCDNDLVYRTVCRAFIPPGVDRVRLSSFRNFFCALEGMSEHWETDMDQYFISGPEGEHLLEPSQIAPGSAFTSPAPVFLPAQMKSADTFGQALESLPQVPSQPGSPSSDACSEEDIPIPMYRGRRISCGAKMPALYRAESVKGFLEAACFPFNCRVSPPRAPTSLVISGIRLPLRHQTFMVHRLPRERETARLGVVEGPLLASFVRPDVEKFSEGTPAEQQAKLRLDMLREIACLYHLAQERRRQGRQEKRWAKKQPSGGYWFSEMASDGGKPDDDALPERLDNVLGGHGPEGRKRKKIKTKYEVWKEMQPMRAQWDARTKYLAVGKDADSDWDEVYMVSSMYHHVSIMKLTVHGAYIDYFTDGTLAGAPPSDPHWSQPTVQRSQWFDLFSIEQRVEAFRCLWGIMSYLTRSGSVGNEETNVAAGPASS